MVSTLFWRMCREKGAGIEAHEMTSDFPGVNPPLQLT